MKYFINRKSYSKRRKPFLSSRVQSLPLERNEEYFFLLFTPFNYYNKDKNDHAPIKLDDCNLYVGTSSFFISEKNEQICHVPWRESNLRPFVWTKTLAVVLKCDVLGAREECR